MRYFYIFKPKWSDIEAKIDGKLRRIFIYKKFPIRAMKKPFRGKAKAEKTETPKIKRETSLTDADYNRRKLFKKGINLMANEQLDDAADVFEQSLRIDPKNVETLLKLGYTRFHLDDHIEALRVYDRILDIDVTNAETWNLKSLVHYEQKNYSKALDCVEKAIDSDPTYGILYSLISKGFQRSWGQF